MAISKLGVAGSDNWELISSVTPTAGVATIDFTGLTPYKKLMLVFQAVVTAAAQDARIRLNNDSGTKYINVISTNSGGVSSGNSTYFTYNISGATSHNGYGIFSSTDTAGVKIFEDGADISGSSYGYARGLYLASATITQISFFTSSTFTATGTVALYGVK